MSRGTQRNPALRSAQRGLSASLRRGRAVCSLVSAELARGVCAVTPLFFFAVEIAAADLLYSDTGRLNYSRPLDDFGSSKSIERLGRAANGFYADHKRFLLQVCELQHGMGFAV